MNPEGLTPHLLWTALVVGGLSLFFFRNIIPLHWLALAVLIKFAIPLVYFGQVLNNNLWLLGDDIFYFYKAILLLDSGYNPLTTLTTPDGFYALIWVSAGRHFLYAWFTLLAFYIFGPYYYSPVFLNVFLTFVSGYFLYKTTLVSGFSKKYSQILFLFFVLQWDVLAWSSFVNLKDIFIMTLTIMLFYYIIILTKQLTILRLASSLGLIFILFFVRLYIPIVFVTAFTLYIAFFSGSYKFKTRYIGILIVISALLVSHFQLGTILKYITYLNIAPSAISYGFVRMVLTPRPWGIEPDYSFLYIPSIFHLIFLIPTIVGGINLWKVSKDARLMIIYLLLSLLLYSSFEELQDPRHRVQILGIIVWMQFNFIWEYINPIVSKMSAPLQVLPSETAP